MFIKVKAFPGCKKEELIKLSADSFEIKVKEPAARGLATKAIIRVLAAVFPNKRIRLVKGPRSRNKIFEI